MQLYFKKYGLQGSPIIILHGLFGMGDNWHNMARKLSETNIVYVLDLRNHGQSPHSELMNYTVMAEDILEFTLLEKLTDIILLGHSMGGKVAMTFALNHPNLIHKLIIVDIAPKEYKPSHYQYFKALKNIKLKAQSRKEIEQQLETQISDRGEILFLLKNLYRKENNEFGLKINLDSIENNYLNIIGSINTSSNYKSINTTTLFIKGENSAYINEKDIIEIKQQFSDVSIVEIKKSGHWVHADNPEDFFNEVLSFINQPIF